MVARVHDDDRITEEIHLGDATVVDLAAPANDDGYPALRPPAAPEPASTLYEEFHPFGTSSYAANDSGIEVSAKRYRYIGKERDEEMGLYHLGARYYASWLGRWTAADPIGLGDGVNRYAYCRGNPVNRTDVDGKAARPMSHDVTYAYESGQGASDVVFEGDRVVGATKVELFEQGGYTDRLTVEGGPAKDVVTRGRENLAEREKVFADIARAKAKKSQVVGAGLQVIGGAAATVAGVVGAGFGGLALAAYGLDNVAAGTGTLATGKQQKTGLNRALKGTAEIAGASEEQAANVADYAELGIGLATGVTSAVRAGHRGGPPGARAIPDEVLPSRVPTTAAASTQPAQGGSVGAMRAPETMDPRILRPIQGRSEMSQSKVKRLEKSMREDGVYHDPQSPIVVGEIEGATYILDGHHRVAASIRAAIREIPVELRKVDSDLGTKLFNWWTNTLWGR